MKFILAVLSSLVLIAPVPVRAADSSSRATAPATPATLIYAGRVFDSEAGQMLGPRLILVQDGRIAEIGSALAVPPGTRRLDLRDYTVLPGLIEAHAHLLMEHPGDEHNTLTVTKAVAIEGEPLRALRGAARARSYLEAGYTTVRDLGNAGRYADVALKRAIAEGSVPGPRLFVSGPGLAPEGGQVPDLAPGQGAIVDGDYRVVRGAEDARQAVREHVYHGVDLVTLYSDSAPNKTVLSVDEMRAIVGEAHRYGLKVSAHAGADDAVARALDAGVDAIEHGDGASEATLGRMGRQAVPLVAASSHEALRRAHAAGVALAAGSDLTATRGLPRGNAARQLLASWREAGLAPRDILQAATINGARLLGAAAGSGLGVLEKGAHADIVAVRGDPLEDLEALGQVVFVMKGGQVVRAPAP